MFKQAIELINFFSPIIVIGIALLGIAATFSNQTKVKAIETRLAEQEIRQSQQAERLSAIEALIKSKMEDPENWNTANQLMNP